MLRAGGTLRRWLLWLTIGALLLHQAGAVVTTRDGDLLLPPGVLTGALIFWVFVTAAVLRRQLARTRRDTTAPSSSNAAAPDGRTPTSHASGMPDLP